MHDSTHVSGHEFCVMPSCEAEPSELLTQPLCSKHAMKIYSELKDLVNAQRFTVRSSPGRPLRNTTDEPGHVYFMDVDGLIKIGFSTNVKQRARMLGGQILATTPGTRREERALHARFGTSWVEGEYFRPDRDLLAYIGSLKS